MYGVRTILAVLVISGTGVPRVQAGLFHREKPGSPGRPRCFDHTMERAGFPLTVSPHAQPTVTPAYTGYFIGGGTAHGGEPRRVEEGTWGLDYGGYHLPRLTRLGWSHGRRFQGGGGTYTTEGFTPRSARGH
jgi:hypothetical protein